MTRLPIPTFPTARRAGITLIELTLVLGLAAIVVFVGIRAFAMAQETSNYNQMANMLAQIRAAASSSIQSGVAPADVPTEIRKKLPTSYYDADGNIRTPIGGVIRVFADNGAYSIMLNNLSHPMCRRIAQIDMGNANGWGIYGNNQMTSIQDNWSDYRARARAEQLTAVIAEACYSATNSLGWSFFQ